MVSLWDLLLLASMGATLAGALQASRAAGGSVGQTIVAILIGVVLGVALITTLRWLGRLIIGADAAPPTGRLLMAYALAVAWTVVSMLVGQLATGVVLRAA